MKLENLTVEAYKNLVDKYGLNEVWNEICVLLKSYDYRTFSDKVFEFDELGKLYEIGLAHTNKIAKKDLGKYYTPKDVATIMSEMLFVEDNNRNLADTGCGTGNLTLEALSHTNKVKNVYLYDLDKTAMNICEAKIISRFGNKFNVIKNVGSFLDMKLPKDIKVIANPPYAKFKVNESYKESFPAFYQSRDLYVGFIENILKYSDEAVLVTPQSFLVGNKFSEIRKQLGSQFTGEIYSFDNIPASLFNGKKEGIFNSNTSNSVRAAIMHLKRSNNPGFRLTHLIRFKEEERSKVLTCEYLNNQLGNVVQDLKQPLKCYKEFEPLAYDIIENSNKTLKSLLSDKPTEYVLRVNNSSRYFTVGAKTKLKRDGYYDVYAKNEESFVLLYALLNSSYCYMFWRMLDGGILYPKSVLEKTPLPSVNVSRKLTNLVNDLIGKESSYLVYKMNAGKKQESVKFPEEFREKLNCALFGESIDFNIIHSNNETLK